MADLASARPRRKLYPPHWVALLAAMELVLNRWIPLAVWVPAPWNYLGMLLALGGVLLGAWAFALFRRAKTGIVPFSEATSLVVTGPYHFSRNPMYVGMLSLLFGLAFYLRSATPFAAPVTLFIILTYRFIRPEEEQMRRTFGKRYEDLTQRVRRWL
jgi:protein-S-isoprenylcysteine O-methyltransferase Ste14